MSFFWKIDIFIFCFFNFYCDAFLVFILIHNKPLYDLVLHPTLTCSKADLAKSQHTETEVSHNKANLWVNYGEKRRSEAKGWLSKYVALVMNAKRTKQVQPSLQAAFHGKILLTDS